MTRRLGARRQTQDVARRFGERLSRAVPLEELLLQLVELLRDKLALDEAEVWSGTAGRLERAVSVPHGLRPAIHLGLQELPVVAQPAVRANAWLEMWVPALLDGRTGATVRMAPAAHSGELFGMLVGVRRGGPAFSADEEQALLDLGRQIGLALRNLHLDSALERTLADLRLHAEELQASRARVVAAADAERRRIERDIHDGAQQHLLALKLKLALASDAIGRDSDEAARLLEELDHDISVTSGQLRTLVQGIYPPQLRSGGLREALATARTAIPLELHVRVDRLPEDVEAAVYFCCLEALQNAAKHAGAGATAQVDVWLEAATVRFTVRDDGAGFDPADTAANGNGAGLVNMADRLGALGGVLDVHAERGAGTCVSGSVPVATVPGGQAVEPLA